jgi:hypothetical protein
VAPILWASGGFVAGVAFWHLVGFWSFVSTAVVADREVPKSASAVPSSPRSIPLETGSVQRPSAGCVSLALNRAKGETRPVPCATGLFHHVDAGLGMKGDRLSHAGTLPGDPAKFTLSP